MTQIHIAGVPHSKNVGVTEVHIVATNLTHIVEANQTHVAMAIAVQIPYAGRSKPHEGCDVAAAPGKSDSPCLKSKRAVSSHLISV